MAATRPTYCGVLLVAAMWLTGAVLCPAAADAGQKTRRKTPVPPFAALFPLEEGWMITLAGRVTVPPAHDGSHIFIPFGDALAALDWDSGDTTWSVPIAASAPPVVAHGVVFVGSGTTLHALDPATGANRWSANASAPIAAIVATGERVITAGPGMTQAFAAATGEMIWTRMLPPAGVPVGAAASTEALVIAYGSGLTTSVALSDGRVQWSRTLTGTPTPPVTTQKMVFIGTTENRFYALDARNGKDRWSWRTGGDVVGAAADAKQVYYTALDAVLRGVNPDNGNQKWKHDTGTRPTAAPIALDGAVVVPGLSPALSAFAPLTGAPLGTYELPGDVAGAPLVRAMLLPRTMAVAVALKDGRVFGLRALSLLFNESPRQPLLTLPGTPLLRERVPAPAPPSRSDATGARPGETPTPAPAAPPLP